MQPRVPPKIAKIRLRIIRVCRIISVLIRMGRLKSPYDPSLIYIFSFFLRQFYFRQFYIFLSSIFGEAPFMGRSP